MSAKLAVLKDIEPAETRVATTPDMVQRYCALGLAVSVESGLGVQAGFADAAYEAAGAVIAGGDDIGREADIVLAVNAPSVAHIHRFKKGAGLIGMLNPFHNGDFIAECARSGVQAMALEFMPRITRAQAMDVLSSQSNLAGYKAVLEAVAHYGRVLPMMMTAAGTIAPARVFVMGVGVAGLQAIATAKRLGAIVSATDIRRATKEQVESLGASFIMVDDEADEKNETSESKSGYGTVMSADYQARQAALISEHIKKQDIVICTALVPGREAPILLNQAQVEAMGAGSVIVDLAVEQGGNCALSQAGRVVDHKGVKIIGHINLARLLPANASALYARNLYNFIEQFFNADGGRFHFDENDEIIAGISLTRDGAVIHPALTEAR